MNNIFNRFSFDFDTATARLKSELDRIAGDEKRMELYDKLMELYSTANCGFDLYYMLKYSRYIDVPVDKPTDFRSLQNFLDLIHHIIHDTMDDGIIHLVKIETVGRSVTFHMKDGQDRVCNAEDSKYFLINDDMLCGDSTADDVIWLKKKYDDASKDFGFDVKYDHLKIIHHYLTFDDVIKVLDRIIKHALTDNGHNESSLDFSDLFSDWNIIDNVK